MDYYTEPDYDYLINILEKSRDNVPFQSKLSIKQLVDNELVLVDPIFTKYEEYYNQIRAQQMQRRRESSLMQKENQKPNIMKKPPTP